MASTISSSSSSSSTSFSSLLQSISVRCVRNANLPFCKAQAPQPASAASLTSRRQLLFLLTAAPALTAREPASLAADIPLFGLRKTLRNAEEETELLVRKGFETAEKGLETAERGIETVERGFETAEKGIETAEREIEGAVSFGALAQAGAVAGAEVVGVLVATSVVNGILGPEGQKS